MQGTQLVYSNAELASEMDSGLEREHKHYPNIISTQESGVIVTDNAFPSRMLSRVRRLDTGANSSRMPASRISLRKPSGKLSNSQAVLSASKRPRIEKVECLPAKRPRRNMTSAQKPIGTHSVLGLSIEVAQSDTPATEMCLSSSPGPLNMESMIDHPVMQQNNDYTLFSIQPRRTVISKSKETETSSSIVNRMEIRYLLVEDDVSPSTSFNSDQASYSGTLLQNIPSSNESNSIRPDLMHLSTDSYSSTMKCLPATRTEITPVVVLPTIHNLCIEGAEGSPNSSPFSKTVLSLSSSPSEFCSSSGDMPSVIIQTELEDPSQSDLSCQGVILGRPLTKEVDWLFRAIPFNNEADSIRRARKTVGFLYANELRGWDKLPDHVFSEQALVRYTDLDTLERVSLYPN
ncbi:hypothetical protein H2248_011851 [Termitomyces sp. 'cryptogamus']|nr:hypothetical protein H2248_011851 [Termitomyces sp. 'cryptogamus']